MPYADPEERKVYHRNYYRGYMKEFYHKNQPRIRKQRLMNRLKKECNFSEEEYDKLVEVQAGCCAICGVEFGDGKVCVDHCHTTMKVRGLLCNECNTAIGFLQDNPQICMNAADYLIDPMVTV